MSTKLKHPKTNHVTIAVLPREIVQLKAAGYVEVKPEPKSPKPDAKS